MLSKETKNNLLKLVPIYIFLALVIVAQIWGGNLLLPALIFVFVFLVAKRLIILEQMIKEIRISAVVANNSPWLKKILSFQTFLTIGCYCAAIFISVSFFLFFYSTNILYKIVIFLDAFWIIWLTKKMKIPFSKHLKEKPLVLICEIAANILNVLTLFITYVIYLLYCEQFIGVFETGTLDPNIPLWVKQNISHSCGIFQKILRINVLIQIATENFVSIESWIHITYKIIHLLTMSFWPFLGITLFYRYFINGNFLLLSNFLISKSDQNGEV